MNNLRSNYRQALKDDLLQEAFDKTWKDWDNEQGAMIYAQVVSTYDLLNQFLATASFDSRCM